MFQIPITSSVAVLTATTLLALSLNVTRLRLRHRVSLGDGGHKDLLAAIRAHGNALEQSLLFILLLLIAESQTHSFALLAGAAIAFLVSRFTHAYGLLMGKLQVRRAGHVGTLIAQLVLVLAVLLEMF